MSGPFCSQCGQRDIPPYPSVRELVVDAFWELSGWDGRFASTIRALFTRPGLLTIEFLKGRRARFISPLRLYLMASLAYFLVASTSPNLSSSSGVSAPGIKIGVTETGPGAVTNAIDRGQGQQITPAQKEKALEQIKSAPAWVRPVLRRAVNDPAGFKRGIYETMPRVLFGLVPVFAGIVAVFYRRRKYPEHLYFALHLHAFVFLALLIPELAKFSRMFAFAAVVSALGALWVVVYALTAFKRVYAESWSVVLLKGLGISALYALAAGAGLWGLVYFAAVYG